MFKLFFKVIRGIILLPVVVVLMTLLNDYEDSQSTVVNTQSVVEEHQ